MKKSSVLLFLFLLLVLAFGIFCVVAGLRYPRGAEGDFVHALQNLF